MIYPLQGRLALIAAICASMLASATSAAGQIPDPPIADSQASFLPDLKKSYEEKSVESYSKLLSEAVNVTIDGKQVANNRKEWIDLFGEKLSTPGVMIKVTNSYAASGTILNTEYFNSINSFPNSSRHCCWRTDAVQYTVASGKITHIRILSGGGDPNP